MGLQDTFFGQFVATVLASSAASLGFLIIQNKCVKYACMILMFLTFWCLGTPRLIHQYEKEKQGITGKKFAIDYIDMQIRHLKENILIDKRKVIKKYDEKRSKTKSSFYGRGAKFGAENRILKNIDEEELQEINDIVTQNNQKIEILESEKKKIF